MNDETGPGITQAADQLETLRERLGASHAWLVWDVGDHEMVMVASEDGIGLFDDGQVVPMRERA